jgi:hypothetical protein
MMEILQKFRTTRSHHRIRRMQIRPPGSTFSASAEMKRLLLVMPGVASALHGGVAA